MCHRGDSEKCCNPCTLRILTPTRYLQDKKLKFCLNGNRILIGTLRGYDAFLNVVLEEAEQPGGDYVGTIVIRGNSILHFEGIERV